MTKPGVEGQLAWRNITEGRGRGRLVVLALLLGAAIVVGAVFSFARDGLARNAAQAAGAPNLPAGADAYVFWPVRALPPADVLDYLQRGLGAYSDTQPVLGFVERYEGPGGYQQVLRVETSVGMAPGEAWFSALQGRYPESPAELAVPRSLAELTGLAPGDLLRLVRHGTGETFSFTVSGVYEPRGSGPFYEMLLAAPVPGEPVVVNLAVCYLPEGALRTLERIQTGHRALAIRDEPVAVRLVHLAREAYSSESAAMSFGFGLTGAAVFAVLLVGFVERRREIAVYKLVGFSGLACTRVLVLELGVAVLAALAAAGPAYYLIAQRLVAGAGSDLGPLVLVVPFLGSALRTVAVTLLGSLYPMTLALVAHPNQLLAGQRIYLVRRKSTLRTAG